MSLWIRIKDKEVRNITALAFLTLVESLQILIIIVTIAHYIPFKLNDFVYTLFPKHQAGVLPEREMLFFRLFVMGNIVLQALMLFVFRKRLGDDTLAPALNRWTLVQSVGIFFQLFAVFKILMYGPTRWAVVFFYAAMILSLLSRIFWPEVCRWGRVLRREVLERDVIRQARWIDAAALVGIVVLIALPDTDKALARIFVNDRMYHFDGFIMASAWAHKSGLILNSDVISQYSTVLPKIVATVTEFLGGLSYKSVLMVLMGTVIVYYGAFYVFLRRLFGRTSVALIGLLLGIKLQMFHTGVFPMIWQFLSPLVVRYVFDIAVLWCLLQHLRLARRGYLWAAAMLTGAAMAYMTDTGLYLLMAYYAYGVFTLAVPVYRREAFRFPEDVARVFGLAVTPWMTALLVLLIANGPAIFQAAFWANSSEHIRLFLSGWGSLPMYDGLKERQFFAFIMGFVIPVAYVWTGLLTGTLCVLSKEKRDDAIMVIITIYGLAMYHYFIYRSAVTSYYVVGLPFVIVVCYWLHQLTALLPNVKRRALMLCVVLLAFGALLTNRFYLMYPNILNTAFLDWKQEEEYYSKEFMLDRDVALIRKLTSPDMRVPVISSFEVKLLMGAERKPFFYYFPLIESGHMRGEHFHGTYLHTRERMQKTLDQLENAKPEFVFVEAKLFKGGLRPEYYSHYQTLTQLVHYMSKHYEVFEDGQYLTALKRRP